MGPSLSAGERSGNEREGKERERLEKREKNLVRYNSAVHTAMLGLPYFRFAQCIGSYTVKGEEQRGLF